MISEVAIKTLMKTHEPAINRIIFNAWQKIHISGLNFKPRGRANIMWDEMTQNAKNEWGFSDDIRIVERRQTAEYWISDSRVVFRLKKCDSDGYTNNYPTQTALKFHDPQIALDLQITKLEVGYVLNQGETDIKNILVIHRHNNTVKFKYSVLMNPDNVIQISRFDAGMNKQDKTDGTVKVTLKSGNASNQNMSE